MKEFNHVLGTLEPWLQHYGVGAMFVILTLESLGAPLPGELLLIVAGILASRGDFSLVGVIASASAGAIIGAAIGYLAGEFVGRALLTRYGSKVGLTAERLTKVEAIFARYGAATVVAARFFVVLRQLNGIVAGIMHMDWRRFMIFNALGSVLWVGAWIMVGQFVGMHASEITALGHRLGIIGVAAALLVLLAVVAFARLRRQG